MRDEAGTLRCGVWRLVAVGDRAYLTAGGGQLFGPVDDALRALVAAAGADPDLRALAAAARGR